jgi:hypothetical protein
VKSMVIIWKAVAAAIVLFWIIMTGQLARLMVFPEGSALAEVPPVFVMDLFLRRGEPSPLVVLKGGRQVGEASVGTKRVEMEGGQGEGEAEEVTQVNIAGFLELDHPMIEADSVSGKIRLNFSDDLTFRGLGLFVRQPGSAQAVDIEYRPDTSDLVYRVLERGKIVEETRPLEDAATMVQAQMLLGMWGMGGPGLMGGGGNGEGEGEDLAALAAKSMRAYHGQVTIRGQRFHAYVVDVRLASDRSLKMVFSEAGELMRVETGLDYELLSEVFVADEVMEEIEGF